MVAIAGGDPAARTTANADAVRVTQQAIVDAIVQVDDSLVAKHRITLGTDPTAAP